MTIPPLTYTWDGNAMVPATPYMARLADQHYCIGENYRLADHHERSAKTHSHFFAALNDVWQTLPERLAEEYPTAEHLRKKALIRCGYADEQSIVCASRAEALRIAAFVRPADDYAIVVVKECVVTRYTAKSQSMRAMGKAEFQQSKNDVLDFASREVGADPRPAANGEAA